MLKDLWLNLAVTEEGTYLDFHSFSTIKAYKLEMHLARLDLAIFDSVRKKELEFSS